MDEGDDGPIAMLYFDNAATTLKKPPGVMRAVRRALLECGGNPGRSSHALSLAAAEGIDAVRVSLAAQLGVSQPEHVVFCGNATAALNMAIMTQVRRGDHILISDREHNAVYRPVCRLAREGIAEFDVFQAGEDSQKKIEALLRPTTRLLICNHVSNVDGHIAPLQEIGRLCRAHGITLIVDAAQSLGHMPFSAEEIQADVVCGPGHKGLFGIQGCGFAWFRRGEGLREFLSGGSGSASRLPYMPPTLPERLEAGTLPTPAIFALGAGLAFLESTTIEAVAEREKRLGTRLEERLSAIPGLQIYHGGGGGVFSVTSDRLSPDALTAALDQRGLCVRGGLHCAPLAHSALGTVKTGTVRISLSYFNTEAEIDRLTAELAALLA